MIAIASALSCPEYDGLEASRLAMVETTSVREERPKLSAKDRLCLIQTINALPLIQFDELVFALDPPKGLVAPNTAAQGQRSKDLLDWLEGPSGPGLAPLDEMIGSIIEKYSHKADKYLAFAISGKIKSSTSSELKAFVELLRRKTGCSSIDIAFFEEGSIKFFVSVSYPSIDIIEELFNTGELNNLEISSIESIEDINKSSSIARKCRLIRVLRLFYKRHGSNRGTNLISDHDLVIDIVSRILHNINLSRDVIRMLIDDIINFFGVESADEIIYSLDINIDRALASAQDLSFAVSTNDTPSNIFEQVRTSNIICVYDLSCSLIHIFSLIHNILHANESTLNHNSIRNLIYNLVRASDIILDIKHNLVNALRSLDPFLDSHQIRNIDSISVLINALSIEREIILNSLCNGKLTLSKADLSGADLSYLNLMEADLTETDLTNADVTGTLLRNNPGLTDEDKQNLQSRGAIILDPPNSDVPALVRR